MIKRSFFKHGDKYQAQIQNFPGVEGPRVRCCNVDSGSIFSDFTMLFIVRSDFSRVSKAYGIYI